MQAITVTATMQDGTAITETTRDFSRFVALVLSFRRDSEVCSVTWTVEE